MVGYDHFEASRKAAKADGFIQVSGKLYSAFVPGNGFRANVSLSSALEFIRTETGRQSGAVPCFDEQTRQWISEFDLSRE